MLGRALPCSGGGGDVWNGDMCPRPAVPPPAKWDEPPGDRPRGSTARGRPLVLVAARGAWAPPVEEKEGGWLPRSEE